MTDLPKPAFITEEEQLEGAKRLATAGDTTKENVEKAVPLGELIWDTDLAHVRMMNKEGDLLYHIFRGKKVPEKFWGQGEYGLVVLGSAEASWPMDKPHVEFNVEAVRQEAYEDDPREPSKYPPCYYGAYLVTIPRIDSKPSLPDERLVRMAELLEAGLVEAIAKWSNGS